MENKDIERKLEDIEDKLLGFSYGELVDVELYMKLTTLRLKVLSALEKIGYDESMDEGLLMLIRGLKEDGGGG